MCLQNTKDSEKASTSGDWQLRVSGGSSFGQDVSRVSVDFMTVAVAISKLVAGKLLKGS